MVKSNMCPYPAFVARKPRPTGGEHKCMADSGSGVINYIEIMEGAESHAGQEFYEEWGYTSALNLRLCKPWHATTSTSHKHIYLGDAHFMGVDELEALLIKVCARVALTNVRAAHSLTYFPTQAGVHGGGAVKGHTKRFPHSALTEECGPEPGDWATMTSELESGHKIFALGHRRGGQVYYLLLHIFIIPYPLTTCEHMLAGAHLRIQLWSYNSGHASEPQRRDRRRRHARPKAQLSQSAQ